MSLKSWLHHLFNPHCPDCIQEKEETRFCASCESLRESLAYERQRTAILTNQLLARTETEKKTEETEEPEIVPVTAMPLRWTARKQMLEAESRAAALSMQKHHDEVRIANETLNKNIEELEKELSLDIPEVTNAR